MPASDFETSLHHDRVLLAPYATFADESRGRVHPEPGHALRSEYQRDRDRIIHSRAFRRLEYKTQVYVTGLNDHFRTRLTHTIEVAGIARTMARALRLNEDLAEAIALAHDLGHPPFGHCGERALNRLLVDHGGFDHNLQALTIVDELEVKYPGYDGLNLCWEVRTGLLKHRAAERPTRLDGEALPPQPALEAQIADLADDLTYYGHDLDDGIGAGLLAEPELRHLAIWQLAHEHCGITDFKPGDRCYYPFMVRNVIDLLVGDAVRTSAARITAANLQTRTDAQHLPHRLVVQSDAFREHSKVLRQFLFERMYWNRAVLDDNEDSVARMSRLFDYFLAHPDDLGTQARERIARVGLDRAVADYISGMTDRYAMEQYEGFVGRRRYQ